MMIGVCFDFHRFVLNWFNFWLKLGYPITENDEFVRIAEGSSNMPLALPLLIMDQLPNWPWSHLVDLLPILKHIPEWFSAGLVSASGARGLGVV
jgi:hypothetical protein